MSENAAAVETAETVVEETVEELTVADAIDSLLAVAFDGVETVTPYKIATLINGTFEVLGVAKRIPTQMMYNYDRNGMIVKGKKGVKAYSKDEVQTYMNKYVNKYAS